MEATGIVRKVDKLGRVILPKKLRKRLYIDRGDPLEIFVEGSSIYLRKYSPGCVFCGSLDNITFFNGVRVCQKCRDELRNLKL